MENKRKNTIVKGKRRWIENYKELLQRIGGLGVNGYKYKLVVAESWLENGRVAELDVVNLLRKIDLIEYCYYKVGPKMKYINGREIEDVVEGDACRDVFVEEPKREIEILLGVRTFLGEAERIGALIHHLLAINLAWGQKGSVYKIRDMKFRNLVTMEEVLGEFEKMYKSKEKKQECFIIFSELNISVYENYLEKKGGDIPVKLAATGRYEEEIEGMGEESIESIEIGMKLIEIYLKLERYQIQEDGEYAKKEKEVWYEKERGVWEKEIKLEEKEKIIEVIKDIGKVTELLRFALLDLRYSGFKGILYMKEEEIKERIRGGWFKPKKMKEKKENMLEKITDIKN